MCIAIYCVGVCTATLSMNHFTDQLAQRANINTRSVIVCQKKNNHTCNYKQLFAWHEGVAFISHCALGLIQITFALEDDRPQGNSNAS